MLKFLHATNWRQEGQANLIGLIAECVSDFATTAASSKQTILSVVRAVTNAQKSLRNSSKDRETFRPQLFDKARHVIKFHDDWESSLNEQSTFSHPKSITIDTVSLDDGEIPFCDDGQTIWVAFNCMISLSSSLYILSLEKKTIMKSILECTFAPTMAVLQHFLKRFPHERYIRESVLKGFKNLADVCIPLSSEDGLHSEALLKCLCRLSLPNWGKVEPNW